MHAHLTETAVVVIYQMLYV